MKHEQESTDEDDVEYRIVANKVAEVTLESDSLPEATDNKKRMKRRTARKPRDFRMDVDLTRTAGTSRRGSDRMEYDGKEEEETSESDSSLCSESSKGKEADDEQSDWVGDCFESSRAPREAPDCSTLIADRRLRHLKRPHQSSIQRKLERFARDPNATGVLTIDSSAKNRDNTNSATFGRLLQMHRLEIVKRSRGTVLIAKKPKV